MKSQAITITQPNNGRSREGARIEISSLSKKASMNLVAPARERGLKSYPCAIPAKSAVVAPARERGLKCTICYIPVTYDMVAPARERGLKLHSYNTLNWWVIVAPARERGLKFAFPAHIVIAHTPSLPRGSVD